MEKHNKYKNSQNDFIGKLPDHWFAKRVKNVALINNKSLNEKTAKDYSFKYIDIGNVNITGIISDPEIINFENAPSRARRIVKKNDVIISTVRTYLKAVAFFPEDPKDVIVSTGFAVLSPYKNIHPNYLAYVVKADAFIDNVIRFSVGVSYPAINTSTLSSLPIHYPPYKEQEIIVSYLDKKITIIDNRLLLLENKIKCYNELNKSIINEAVCFGLNKNTALKESGIKWLNLMPKDWKISRLKDVGYLYSGLSGKTGDHFNKEITSNSKYYIPFTNIANNKYINHKDLHNVILEPGEKQNKVNKNDLFFLMSSEGFDDIGKASLLIEEVPETYLNSFCKGFRITNKSIIPRYLNYLLNSKTFRDKLISQGKGFTRINLKMEKISDLHIVLPPAIEQNAIAEYLDRKTSLIEAIIKNIVTQIEVLKELRRTLINDAVVGKIISIA